MSSCMERILVTKVIFMVENSRKFVLAQFLAKAFPFLLLMVQYMRSNKVKRYINIGF